MGLKEFFRPTKGKIILFILMIAILYIYITLTYVCPFDSLNCPTAIENTLRLMGHLDSIIFYIGFYLLSCFINYIIKKIRK